MSDIAVRVENLGKLYRIGQQEPYLALRDSLTRAMYLPFRTLSSVLNGHRTPKPERPEPDSDLLWALRNVSFEVKRGEVVGIIGRNGSGKSTLLKVLSRITEPTEGQAEVRGRVGSLLEVGTGFHPELTGRENVYLNGAILGMKKAEIDRKFDEIVAFAEIERFMDTPVKRYSSGMFVRLAFAVAAHLEPDVLLVDEVLAVGDAAFQKKCLGKMGDVAKEGRTVLFVSHNMGAIASLCQKVAYLSAGQLRMIGMPHSVINRYMADVTVLSGNIGLTSPLVSRRGDGAVRFSSARLLDLEGSEIACAQEEQPFGVELSLLVSKPVDLRILSITLVDSFGNDLATTMHYDNLLCEQLDSGSYVFTAVFDPNRLRRGTFNVRLACFGPNFYEYDHIHHAFTIIVSPSPDDPDSVLPRPGVVDLDVTWHMRRTDEHFA